jgi:hypothetical protein
VGLQLIIYYIGFVLAIALCWGLGRLFYVPMIVDMAFNLCLNFRLFAGWDIRWLIVGYGFAIFVWVVALSSVMTRSTYVVMLVADMLLVFKGIVPQITVAGTGGKFWDISSTGIFNVWMMSVSVLVISMVVKGAVLPAIRRRRVDIITNPRKRFLLPIGAWATIIVASEYLGNMLPVGLYNSRYVIASYVLVWGWVAFELPFYLMYRRLSRTFGR